MHAHTKKKLRGRYQDISSSLWLIGDLQRHIERQFKKCICLVVAYWHSTTSAHIYFQLGMMSILLTAQQADIALVLFYFMQTTSYCIPLVYHPHTPLSHPFPTPKQRRRKDEEKEGCIVACITAITELAILALHPLFFF